MSRHVTRFNIIYYTALCLLCNRQASVVCFTQFHSVTYHCNIPRDMTLMSNVNVVSLSPQHPVYQSSEFA